MLSRIKKKEKEKKRRPKNNDLNMQFFWITLASGFEFILYQSIVCLFVLILVVFFTYIQSNDPMFNDEKKTREKCFILFCLLKKIEIIFILILFWCYNNNVVIISYDFFLLTHKRIAIKIKFFFSNIKFCWSVNFFFLSHIKFFYQL